MISDSTASSAESDSGLSCFDSSTASAISRGRTPVDGKSSSLADSGRRTQSLELLTDDFSSVRLTPTPPPTISTKVKIKREKHLQFADELERSKGVSSPALSAPPNIESSSSRPQQKYDRINNAFR